MCVHPLRHVRADGVAVAADARADVLAHDGVADAGTVHDSEAEPSTNRAPDDGDEANRRALQQSNPRHKPRGNVYRLWGRRLLALQRGAAV